jgi:hypothetical protein
MEVVNPDVNGLTIEEKLERAAAVSSPKATVEVTPTEEVKETVEGGGENRIPQHRFNEVNSALKEARASEASVKEALLDSQNKLVKMAELLEAKDEDVRTLNEIKSYVNDPAMADHIYAIDAKLKGIELEVKSGKTTPEDALTKTQDLLRQTREEAADAHATVMAETLVTKADIIAEKLLAQLPKEYTTQDRDIITDLWTEKMDWNAAVADPDNLSAILTEKFQETLNRYGTPRGAMFSTEEVSELLPEKANIPMTPEQELEAILGLEWGKTNQVETKTGMKSVPELSDEAFSDAMAHLIRKASGR